MNAAITITALRAIVAGIKAGCRRPFGPRYERRRREYRQRKLRRDFLRLLLGVR